MKNELDIKDLVESVIRELKKADTNTLQKSQEEQKTKEEPLPNLLEYNLYDWTSIPAPENPEALKNMAAATPARIGVWRAGPRPTVENWLRFRADHAIAQDAVMKEIDPAFIESFGLFSVQTRARCKDEYLTRPDLGRRLSEEGRKEIVEKCPKGAQIQIVVVDGLSSAAIEENLKDFLPAFEEAIKSYGLKTGIPFFVKYGRVGVMDEIGEMLEPEVVLELVGERPGLVTATSMSAYMCYRPNLKTVESDRTLVANIHKGGLPAVEAAAHVAGIMKQIYDAKASGMTLRANNGA